MTVKFIPNVQVEKDLEYRLRNIELIREPEIRTEKLLAYMDFCSILMGRLPNADSFYNRANIIYKNTLKEIKEGDKSGI